MMLNLSVDTGDTGADEAAHMTGLLAYVLNAALKHGHTASLSAHDLSATDDDVVDTPEDDAYRRGYRDGHRDGLATSPTHRDSDVRTDAAFDRGYKAGRSVNDTVRAKTGTEPGVLVVPDDLVPMIHASNTGPGIAVMPLYDDLAPIDGAHQVVIEGVGRLRIPAGATVQFIPHDHVVKVPDGADNPGVWITDALENIERARQNVADEALASDRANEVPEMSRYPRKSTTFPGTDGSPGSSRTFTPPNVTGGYVPFTGRSPLCESDTHLLCPGCACSCHGAGKLVVPETMEYTTDVFPPVLPAPEGSTDTWIYDQVASEQTSVLPVPRPAKMNTRPDGDRPLPGPGAPISAYDALSAETAQDSFGFPAAQDSGDGSHTDTEGALWLFARDRKTWDRITYPLEWAPASPVDVTPIHFATDADI